MPRFSRPLNRHNRRKLRRSPRAARTRDFLWVIAGVALVLIVAAARARLESAF